MKKHSYTFLLLAAFVLLGWSQGDKRRAVEGMREATVRTSGEQQRVATVELFCHPILVESSVSSLAHTATPPLQHTHQHLLLASGVFTHRLFSRYCAYVLYALRVLYCIPRTDFIFPFHHFW